ncbi:GTPase HflX [Olsenella sp. YH-ols2217]|uniref:GTPase HflX n=1 Tax=Kribbibacterium absianum TaxID=3044210 RepID=A0ABT6ZIU7_9ACTN|nr:MULTISPECIES: GTPase HflX [unclassified Olsenella]MDJ1121482.1 GTPase HflX [Olsenella sp. YH-ols2216]MDJ1128972.1 GTPase HflX [Olsenella sp. YH-ols2217]
MATRHPLPTAAPHERAILVGVDRGGSCDWPLAESLAELERLVETDGAIVVGELTQRLDQPVPKTFIGSGKAAELKELVQALDADVVVFDDELKPTQQANLERILGRDVKVIDRTALILDIFGRHAATKEGRLQVQEAQLAYVLPRLRGMWSHLMGEQTRGGIGSRFGQGESQLEVDRRLVRNRLSALRKDLAKVETQRETQSKARWDSGVYRVAFAGYTNAGKSTLLNALTGADVYAKDELFATLDPTTRALDLAEGRKVTLTDTVGFIQKIPTRLVQSFKSTLAEVRGADLVLDVVDASDPQWPAQVRAVEETLASIDAGDIDRVLVLNKVDLLSSEDRERLRLEHPEAVLVSATEGTGLDGLLHRVALEAAKGDVLLTALIPYSKGLLTKAVHEQGQIVRESYGEDGLLVTARVPERLAGHLAPYRVEE